MNEPNTQIFEKIEKTNTVSIHIRRGDYLKDKQRNNICNVEYYKLAIEKIKTYIEHPSFFVFSDDINWCKENFQNEEFNFIDWNTGNNSFIDMQLMSNCKHNIIANSSFSWWAAWLNINSNKIIIGPMYWFDNITSNMLCDTWQYI